MQGLEFVLVVALLWSCHPKKRAQQAEVEAGTSTPAEASPDTKEPAPQGSADEGSAKKKTCLAISTPPKLLSETGCVDPKQPSQPALGVVPYEVIAPLWSDGSDKSRFIAVPEGEKATFTAAGNLDLPVGGVVIKMFKLQDKPVETRFYMRESQTRWRAYTYAWRDDGSDAELLTDGREKTFGSQTWVYPSPRQCDMCHNKATNVTLGLNYAQLAKKDQLAKLAQAGILDEPPAPLSKPLVDYRDSNEPIDARARSYLQSNCALCHQPQGGGVGNFDFRMQKDFAAMGICNTAPLLEVFPDVVDSKIYKPGVPAESVILLRMKDAGDFHMPPQVSRQVDTAAVELMEKWVLLRSNCDP